MANRWSHAHGKTSPEVVPFTWQPTPSADARTLHTLSYLDRDASVICSALSGRQRRLLEKSTTGQQPN